MLTSPPIHLLAKFAGRDPFFTNYMYHVPSGGLFIDLTEGTSLPLMSRDARELLGQIVEVRVVISKPHFQMDFRGAVTYAAPYRLGQKERRIGIEFFSYETPQKDFLLDLLNEDLQALVQKQIALRKHRRLPAGFRVQFDCLAPSGRCAFRVTGRMTEMSRSGLSFRTIRFLQPGSKVKVTLHCDGVEGSENVIVGSVTIPAIVRWSDADNFHHRQMGLEFDFDQAQDASAEEKVRAVVDCLQAQSEANLITRRLARHQQQA